MYNNAYLENIVQYDAKDDFLSTIRHEALYCAYILTRITDSNNDKKFKINCLLDLPEQVDFFNNNLESEVIIQDESFTYGVCLFNKWCGFDKVILNEPITKKQIQKVSRQIFEFFGGNPRQYNDHLFELEKKLMFFITITNHIPSLSLEEMVSLVDDNTHELIRKLPDGNAYVSYHINNGLIDRCIDNFPQDLNLYKLFKSGSRFSKTQLARSCINIGLLADEKNVVHQDPIKTSLIEGLTEEEFFKSSPGTRKGLIDKDRSVPESGYLERSLVMAMSSIEIIEDDCGCKDGLPIKIINKQHFNTLIGKYYKKSLIDREWLLLTESDIDLIEKNITIRSPMTCQTKNFKICKKCFGEKRTRTKYIGVTAGQCITERLTQLLLRSFHVSGSCELSLDPTVSNFIRDYLIDITTPNKASIKLIFNEKEKIPLNFQEIPGFLGIENNTVLFGLISEEVVNNDTLSTVVKIKELLRKNDKVILTPSDYYQEFIDCILSVGGIYSSFVEMVLAHIFMVNETEFWRYNQDKDISVKLSEKSIAVKISPLLGFLYQPNRISIGGIEDDHLVNNNFDEDNLSFHEKIFLQKF